MKTPKQRPYFDRFYSWIWQNLRQGLGLENPDRLIVKDNSGLFTRPLHLAVGANDLSTTTQLLARGAIIDLKDSLARTPLYLAVTQNNLEISRTLLQHNADPDIMNTATHVTALHHAAENSPDMAQLLLQHHAGMNYRETEKMETPLFRAVRKGCLKTVDLLLREGAVSSLRNADGVTARGLAVALKFDEIAARLYWSEVVRGVQGQFIEAAEAKTA